MKRRQFIKFSALMAGVTASSAFAMGRPSVRSRRRGRNNRPNLNLKTSQPLYIPPLYEGVMNDMGQREYYLSINESTHEFFEGVETDTWSIGYEGVELGFLGPVLKMTKGEYVRVRYYNALPETTTMHGHGMHVPAAMDGGPHQRIASGEEWIAEYVVDQPASTNWFHPHEMGKTAEHVYKGLAGLIFVEDDTSSSLALPNTYGVDDVPLVLQDRVFDGNGQLLYNPRPMDIMRGYHGDVWLANGQVMPVLDAGQGLLRLRLLNGSNAGIYQLSFDKPNVPLYLVGTDGGLKETPVPIDGLTLTAGERAEILLDLTGMAGEELVLKVSESLSGKKGSFLRIKVRDYWAEKTAVPVALASLELYNKKDAVRTRRFVLGMGGMRGGMSRRGFFGGGRSSGGGMQFTINGKSMDMNRIDEVVPIDQVEIWEIENPMMMAHNFHVHAIHFIPLDRNGRKSNLAPWERDAYKDTLYMPPRSRARVLVKMKDYTDPQNPYMYHCHILEHEDAGMMGQFTVV